MGSNLLGGSVLDLRRGALGWGRKVPGFPPTGDSVYDAFPRRPPRLLDVSTEASRGIPRGSPRGVPRGFPRISPEGCRRCLPEASLEDSCFWSSGKSWRCHAVAYASLSSRCSPEGFLEASRGPPPRLHFVTIPMCASRLHASGSINNHCRSTPPSTTSE